MGRRVSGLLSGAWGAVTGGAPHVLHHVGPLAGAAFLGGSFGRGAFFVAGLLLSVPLLRRLRRRTGSLVAPAAAVALFAATFAVSSLVVSPRLVDDSRPVVESPAGHDRHHLKSPPTTDTLGGYPKEKP